MVTRKHLVALAGSVAMSAALAAPASATTTIAGSVSNITYHGADPGLVIVANALAFPSFSLNPGESFEVDLLEVGTREGTVNTDFLSLFGEDTVPYPISVDLSFTDPTGVLGGPIGGSTFGFIAPLTSCGWIAGGCGAVQWGGPMLFSFGDGGQFSVQLSDEIFGTPGMATVKGTFTLISDSLPPVPEPSTWALMILGFGALGAAMRGQARRRTTVSYS